MTKEIYNKNMTHDSNSNILMQTNTFVSDLYIKQIGMTAKHVDSSFL